MGTSAKTCCIILSHFTELCFLRRYGFREQVEVTLLGVDPVLATVVFGITRTGAVPNNTGVNNRNLWHNTLAVTEHINRCAAPCCYRCLTTDRAPFSQTPRA